MTVSILRTLTEMRAVTKKWRAAGERIAVVPTMGALHQGHLSLVKAAKAQSDRVVVTIFVNPTQFNDPKDLESYPRTEHQDAKLLEPLGADVVYVPDLDQVYPDGFSSSITVSGISDGLCGAGRPGHFDGVATVVCKLFLQTGADTAFFGEKDYQQLQVVTRMALDLDIPITVIGCPTIRDRDGLAQSSRNLKLTKNGRVIAPVLYQALNATAADVQNGAVVSEALSRAQADILAAGFAKVEYLEMRAANGLAPLDTLNQPARLLVAAWLDGVRLIDNIAITPAG